MHFSQKCVFISVYGVIKQIEFCQTCFNNDHLHYKVHVYTSNLQMPI